MFSPTSTNVTVMFPSGAGVEVRLRGATVTTTILLPAVFKGFTLGLLGKMNGDATDDLVFSTGQSVQNHTDPVELFDFGASCETSLHTKCNRKLIYCVVVLWACKEFSNISNNYEITKFSGLMSFYEQKKPHFRSYLNKS